LCCKNNERGFPLIFTITAVELFILVAEIAVIVCSGFCDHCYCLYGLLQSLLLFGWVIAIAVIVWMGYCDLYGLLQ
jgi:hypothetical protein